MKKRWSWLATFGLILVCFFLNACGGGGGGGTPSSSTEPIAITEPVSITGQFIDSAVSGLIYQCSSGDKATTNTEGEFTCQVGEDVEFFVNNYSIGSATAKRYITPYDLYPTDENAAIDVSRLLLTLDSDGVASNGITIPENLPPSLGEIAVRPGDPNFATAMATALDVDVFVNENEAENHLQTSYGDLLAKWDFHLDIGTPFYNVFFEEGKWEYITFELTSATTARATFDGTTYNGNWTVDENEILNITVTGKGASYWKLLTVYDNRLDVCFSESLNGLNDCSEEYFYFSLKDAQPSTPDDFVTISGQVVEAWTNVAISGAVVSTSLDSETATTDASGKFFLQTSTKGDYSSTPYTVNVSAEGYETESLTLAWGDRAENQTFQLVPIVTPSITLNSP